MVTLRYESITGSPRKFFRHADVKALSIRKLKAFANSDKIELSSQAIGKVHTYSKTDYNPSRRLRINWDYNYYFNPQMLETLETGEMKSIAEYDKKWAESKK